MLHHRSVVGYASVKSRLKWGFATFQSIKFGNKRDVKAFFFAEITHLSRFTRALGGFRLFSQRLVFHRALLSIILNPEIHVLQIQ